MEPATGTNRQEKTDVDYYRDFFNELLSANEKPDIAFLPWRIRFTLCLLYGLLDNGHRHTYSEAGYVMKLPKENVMEMENKGLKMIFSRYCH